jgi:hypothetical protein
MSAKLAFMSRTNWLRRSVRTVYSSVVLACALVTACGGGGDGNGSVPAVPVISSLSPASAIAGGSSFTLTVGGADFVTGSVVLWNGADRPTTYGSSTQLSAVIAAADIAGAGTAQVTVRTPSPGGGTSAAQGFAINHPQAMVVGLNPAAATAGGSAFTLTVTGTGFVSASTVTWNGADRATTFVSATQLTASIPAADIAAAGTAQIAVRNPAPGGGLSAAVAFTVSAPPPILSSLEPTSVAAGFSQLVLTLRGVSFIAGAVARWDEEPLATTFRSATELAAEVPAARLQTLRDVPVTVTNPQPGGGESAALPLRVGGVLRISVTNDGTDVDGGSDISALSADGRYVAFASKASHLVPGDTNDAFDVFRRDTCFGAGSGCVPSAVRVSLTSTGQQSAGGTAFFPKVSLGGRYVSFVSTASDYVPDDVNTVDDLFLRDTCLGAAPGCTPSTTALSLSSAGELVGGLWSPALSDDARYGVFTSSEWRYVAGDTNGTFDVFLRDTCIGAPAGCLPTTRRLSVAFGGGEGNGLSISPAISADGRFVGFSSGASNLVPGGVTPTYFLNTYVVETRP